MSRQEIPKLEKLDALAAAKLGRFKHKPAAAPVVLLGELSDQPPLAALSAVVGLYGLARGDQRALRAGLRMGLSLAVATAIKTVIKHAVDRTRPRVLVESGLYESGPGEHDDSDYNSFPSGHSAGALAVAKAFTREFPDTAPAAYATATVAGVAQLVRRQHYPTDVAVGFVVGLVGEAIVDRAFDAVGRTVAGDDPIRSDRDRSATYSSDATALTLSPRPLRLPKSLSSAPSCSGPL